MHYLLLTGALCLTGGYKILASSQIALGKTIFSVFFKSWARENADSVVSSNKNNNFESLLFLFLKRNYSLKIDGDAKLSHFFY